MKPHQSQTRPQLKQTASIGELPQLFVHFASDVTKEADVFFIDHDGKWQRIATLFVRTDGDLQGTVNAPWEIISLE